MGSTVNANEEAAMQQTQSRAVQLTQEWDKTAASAGAPEGGEVQTGGLVEMDEAAPSFAVAPGPSHEEVK